VKEVLIVNKTFRSVSIATLLFALVVGVDLPVRGQVLRSSKQKKQDEASVQTFTDAAMRGDRAKVESLLARGMSINAEPAEHKGWTALMAAVTFGRFELVDLLLRRGANAQVRLEDGSTTLYQAAQSGDRRIVEELLAAGAKVNETTREGRTALIRFAWMGQPELVKLTLGAGADASLRDKNGDTALDFAARYGDSQSLKTLIPTVADINVPNGSGVTPLMEAAWNPNPGVIETVLAAGADPNVRDENGETALMFAARSVFRPNVRTLLKAGANPNLRDHNGWTALMHASANAQSKEICGNNSEFERLLTAGGLVSDLIDAGADVNFQSTDGDTAIKLAVMSGHGEIVKVLLARAANLDSLRKLEHKKLYMRTAQRDEDRVIELGQLLKSTNAKP
jgi:ankyrin repeat protein